MKYSSRRETSPALVCLVVLGAITLCLVEEIPLAQAASSSLNSASSSVSETSSSASQPLWSYQVKPGAFSNIPLQSQQQQYGPLTGAGGSVMPSLFEAFNGLSQRQGALSGSPFLSILPIILIAAGGLLLLLPLLTMMMASPFGGGLGGGFNNGPFGYSQVGLNKKRSLNDQHQRGLLDLIEHVSSSIEELSKKYGGPAAVVANNLKPRVAKAMNPHPTSESPANHRSSAAPMATVGDEQATAIPTNVVGNSINGA